MILRILLVWLLIAQPLSAAVMLKADTAKTVRIGPFLDSTDGDTEEIALTIAQADIRLSKNGAAFAQTADVGGATHDENGWYSIQLAATDTDTEGDLTLYVHVTGALPVYHYYQVVSANVYDSLYAAEGTDELQADVTQVNGSTTPVTNFVEVFSTDFATAWSTDGWIVHLNNDAITGAKIAANAIGSSEIADDSIGAAKIADGAITSLKFATGAITANAIADDAIGVAEAGFLLDSTGFNGADVPAILADTDDIGVAGAGLTGIPWNAAWDTEVESEANDAIVANHLDHFFNAAYDPALKPGSASGLMNVVVEDDAGVPRFTANALEQGPSGTGLAVSDLDNMITKYHLDHFFFAAYDPTAKPGDASGLANVLVENDAGVPRYTQNALEQAPTGSAATLSADKIADARTFFATAEGYKAENIITLNTWSSGTRTLACDFRKNGVLNEGTSISTVDSVTVTNDSSGATVATSSLVIQQNYERVNFDVAAISSAGTFTVLVEITTTDSQPLSIQGTLEVVAP